VKFTFRGGVSIDVRQLDSKDSNIDLEFCVIDTGIGIPQEKQASIFDAFTQVDATSTREFGGTGLGLAICAQLVNLMGGKIWVESEVGSGSKFFFTATFEVPEAEAVVAPASISQSANEMASNPAAAKRSLDILLVEDNLINQRVAVRLLQNNGHRVTVAGNGREAIDTLSRFDWKFDAVFMDIQMPQMDGLTATREIRRMESLGGKHMPVIALTAHAMETDKEECLAAGMDRHLSKPIRVDLLLAILAEIADGTFEQSEPAPALTT
jgi:CheY-like chemotaxis protein